MSFAWKSVVYLTHRVFLHPHQSRSGASWPHSGPCIGAQVWRLPVMTEEYSAFAQVKNITCYLSDLLNCN